MPRSTGIPLAIVALVLATAGPAAAQGKGRSGDAPGWGGGGKPGTGFITPKGLASDGLTQSHTTGPQDWSGEDNPGLGRGGPPGTIFETPSGPGGETKEHFTGPQ